MSDFYQIRRVYNNNAILVLNQTTRKEAVLVGKGIGFGKKINDIQSIPPSQVEKHFITYEDNLKSDYLKLVQQLDESILALCSELILFANERIGPLHNRIHIVLTDHIGFALERMKAGIDIHNPFLAEIKVLYAEEFKIALKAKNMIKEELKLDIAEDEVGFIALHLGAARQKKEVKESLKNTRLVKEVVDIIESHLGLTIPKDLTYTRLIQHLRSTIDRVCAGQNVENPLIKILKIEMKESYDLAINVATKIEEAYGFHVPEGEVGFIAIHIDRLKRNVKFS